MKKNIYLPLVLLAIVALFMGCATVSAQNEGDIPAIVTGKEAVAPSTSMANMTLDVPGPIITINCGGKQRAFHDISCYNFQQINRLAIVVGLREMVQSTNAKARATYDQWCRIMTEDFKECQEPKAARSEPTQTKEPEK